MVTNEKMTSLFDAVGSAVVDVLLPIPAERAYSYSVPEEMHVSPGDFVQVPLGPRKVAGVVWDRADDAAAKPVDPSKLRAIEHRFDCPPVSSELRRFIDWLADYTVSSPGMVVRSLLRVPAALDPEPPIAGLRYLGTPPERMTAARERLIGLLDESPGLAWTKSGLAHAAGVTPSVVDGLVKQGLFETVSIPAPSVVPVPITEFQANTLSPEQVAAADAMRRDRKSVV